MPKVRVCLNKMSNGKIEISCLKPELGGAAHSRPYDSETDAKKTLLAFGCFTEDEVNAYLATLREIGPMELMKLGDYEITDEDLVATGFTAV